MRGNIFLIGFMGAGKSAVARCLKKTYGMRLIEMDEQIEAREGMSVSRIFELRGEEYFRRLETELLEGLQQENNTVVSCGGGAALRERNVKEMKKNGKIVYLDAEAATIYKRVKNLHTRPLLEGNMNVGYIQELLRQRAPRYQAAADLTVSTDGRNVEDICREIMAACE